MADNREDYRYGPRRTAGAAGQVAGRVSSIPAVESWMRGPAADRFARIAEKAAKAGYSGADDAAAAFAHRMTAGSRQAHQVAVDMRRFIRRNPVSAAPSATAPASATAREVSKAAGRAAGEGTADFVARKIAERQINPGTWKGIVQAVKNGARGLTSFMLGAPGTRVKNLGKGALWGWAIHGALEGGGATIDLAKDLSDPESRRQLGGRSAWYDYVNPLPVKGGINPDEVQHNLSSSLKRFAANTLTLGFADWGQGDYDPKSDPDSYAAMAARTEEAAQKMRDDYYRQARDMVTRLSTYTPGSDVGSFIRAAAKGAKELTDRADAREKSLPPRSGKENSTISYARELIALNRKNALDIESGALASVRAAYKDDQAGYRKLLEDKMDREILPKAFPAAFPDGLTYDPNREWSNPELKAEVTGFRDRLLKDPTYEYAILGYGKEED